jgi:hypothetical protein
LLTEVSGGEGAQSLPSNLGFIIDTSDSMRIRVVSEKQFAELAKKGLAKEVMTDGVPAYQITFPSNERMASASDFPRRIDYVSEALVIASEYLRPVDCFSLVAFAGQAHLMIPSTSGKERNRLRQAARELEYLRLGDGTLMADGMALAFAEVTGNSQPQPSEESQTTTFAGRLILLTDGHTRNVSECYEWARRARQANLKLTTMGIGIEFNEDLLIPLADLTSGKAYYIETPDQIPEAFRQELGAALRVSYQNVEIKLGLPEGVELRKAYRVLPETSEFDPGPNLDGSYSLVLGDYDPAEPAALLFELVIAPRPAGNYRLAQALLVWDDPASEPVRQNQRQEVILQASGLPTGPLDGYVMNIVERVGAFKMGTQALQAAHNAAHNTNPAERNAATLRLRQAATRLLDMGESDIAEAMFHQAQALEQSGSMDPQTTKKLKYATRRLTQR